MLTLSDAILLPLILVGLPLRAWFAMRRLARVPPAEAARLRAALWARAVATQWTLAAGVLALWAIEKRWWRSLGLSPTFTWASGGILLGLVVLAVAMHSQRRALPAQPDVAVRLRARLANVERLMPHARSEWTGFAALAVTAGVCEELMFRGYLTWALSHVLPSYAMAGLAQAVLFGLAHAYQGVRGVFLTMAVGAFLTVIVWMTGTLWVAMLIHALMDLNAGDLAIRVYGLPDGSAGAEAG